LQRQLFDVAAYCVIAAVNWVQTVIPTAAYLAVLPSSASLRKGMWKRNVQIFLIRSFNPLNLKKKVQVLLYLMLLDFWKCVALWKVPRLRPFVLLARAHSEVLSTAEMI
jgi:hypothetical protein